MIAYGFQAIIFLQETLMKKLFMRLSLALLALGQVSFGVLTTDDQDVVTYGAMPGKWKNIIDSLFTHKVKNDYMMFRLYSLQDSSPFIGSYEFGFAKILGADKASKLTFAIGYADNNTLWTVSNFNIANTTNGLTTVNGTNQFTNTLGTTSTHTTNYNPNIRDQSARTIEGVLGFSTKVGEAFLNLQYNTTLSPNLVNYFQIGVPSSTVTNGGQQSSFSPSHSTNGFYQDAGSYTHQLAVGFISGDFGLNLKAQYKYNTGSMQIYGSTNTTVGYQADQNANLTPGTTRVSSLSRTITEGSYSTTAAASLNDSSIAALRNTQWNLFLRGELDKVADMKLYVIGYYNFASFDLNENIYRSMTESVTYNTNTGKATQQITNETRVSYVNAVWQNPQVEVRMKRVWTAGDVTFGTYMKYNLSYIYSSYSALPSATYTTNDTGLGSTNTVTKVGATNTKTVQTWTHTVSLPVMFSWKADKVFTVYAGAEAKFVGMVKNTTTASYAGTYLATSNVGTVAGTLVNASTSDAPKYTYDDTYAVSTLLTGTYSLGFNWKPADAFEFQVMFQGLNPFNQGGSTSSIFNKANVDVIWNF